MLNIIVVLHLLANHAHIVIGIKNAVVLPGAINGKIVALNMKSGIQTFLVLKNIQVSPITLFL